MIDADLDFDIALKTTMFLNLENKHKFSYLHHCAHSWDKMVALTCC